MQLPSTIAGVRYMEQNVVVHHPKVVMTLTPVLIATPEGLANLRNRVNRLALILTLTEPQIEASAEDSCGTPFAAQVAAANQLISTMQKWLPTEAGMVKLPDLVQATADEFFSVDVLREGLQLLLDAVGLEGAAIDSVSKVYA